MPRYGSITVPYGHASRSETPTSCQHDIPPGTTCIGSLLLFQNDRHGRETDPDRSSCQDALTDGYEKARCHGFHAHVGLRRLGHQARDVVVHIVQRNGVRRVSIF